MLFLRPPPPLALRAHERTESESTSGSGACERYHKGWGVEKAKVQVRFYFARGVGPPIAGDAFAFCSLTYRSVGDKACFFNRLGG